MHNNFSVLAALVTSAALVGPAQASVSAQGQVVGVSIEIVDLDPNDGIAASATWADGGAFISGSIDGGPGAPLGFALPSAVYGGPLSDTLSTAFAAASASVSPTALLAGGSATGRSFYASATSGYGLYLGGIVLGAHTSLRMTLDYQLSASVTALDPSCTLCNYAQVNLSAILGVGQADPAFQTAFAAAYADFGPASDSVTDSFALRWDNGGPSSTTVSVGISLIAQGQDFTAAVPEPSTSALLLAGVAAVGALARRRSGRAGRG